MTYLEARLVVTSSGLLLSYVGLMGQIGLLCQVSLLMGVHVGGVTPAETGASRQAGEGAGAVATTVKQMMTVGKVKKRG